MNISLQRGTPALGQMTSVLTGGGLKSTQEKLERQAKCASQIEFFEQQKEKLKQMECDTVEEIVRKLEMFHAYEDQIAAVKSSYNSEQMWHVLDEAREQGEKIAEKVEETAPKTPEERKEEQAEKAIEEAAGVEDNDSMLEDLLDTADEITEELLEETTEELEELTEEELAKLKAQGAGGLTEEELAKLKAQEAGGLTAEETARQEAEAALAAARKGDAAGPADPVAWEAWQRQQREMALQKLRREEIYRGMDLRV